jgi:hypothetical protein
MSDPASIAALDVLTKVLPATLHIDVRIFLPGSSAGRLV